MYAALILALLLLSPQALGQEVYTSPKHTSITGTATPDPPGIAAYWNLSSIAYDDHVHSAISSTYECLAEVGYDNLVGCHQETWCADVYQQARNAGLGALNLVHHTHSINDSEGITAWKTLGVDGVGFTDPNGTHYPMHSGGYPLLESGGFTDIEVEYLIECAGAATVPGEFIGIFGGEWTLQAFDSTTNNCDETEGQGGCGGHKEIMYKDVPATPCTVGAQGLGTCDDEGEMYDVVTTANGYFSAGHPTGSGAIGQDFTPFDAGTERGGFSDTRGRAFEFSASGEDTDCFNASPGAGAPDTLIGGCGYRAALAWGHKLFPVGWSDSHSCPETGSSECSGSKLSAVGTGARGIALANQFTKTGFFGAVGRRSVFWAASGIPTMHVTLEGELMGAEVTPDGDLDMVFYFHPEDMAEIPSAWEFGCLSAATDGGDGGWTVEDTASCSITGCEGTATITPGTYIACYLRIERSGPNVIAVSAPFFMP